jgi:anti-sigma28 factor (negative regulator of flagellin synthesis)
MRRNAPRLWVDSDKAEALPSETAIVKSAQQRQQEQREKKLEEIRKQVEDGSLVIRKMTAEERKANPPRERKTKKS